MIGGGSRATPRISFSVVPANVAVPSIASTGRFANVKPGKYKNFQPFISKLTYQWYLDGAAIPGQTGRRIDKSTLTGSLTVREIATNDFGSTGAIESNALAVAPPRRQVTTRAALPQTYIPQSGGYAGNQVQQSMLFDVKKATNNLVIRYANYSVDAAPSKLLAGQYSFTVKAAIIIAGVSYPVVFEAGRTQNVPVDMIVSSQPLNIPGGIPAGTRIELRDLKIFSTAPSQWACGTRYNLDQGGRSGWNQFGNALTDEVDTLTTFYTRPTNFMVLPPFQIVGDSIDSDMAVEIMGDSIGSDGSADGFLFNAGFSQRALDAAGIAFTNNGASGNSMIYQMETWASPLDVQARRRKAHAFGAITHVFCCLSTNDWASGANPNQLLTYYSTLKAELNALGIKLIVTNGYPRAAASNDGKLAPDPTDIYDRMAAFRLALATNPTTYADYVFDTYSVLKNAANENFWNPAYIGDGVHPNPAGHTALANYCQPLFQALQNQMILLAA